MTQTPRGGTEGNPRPSGHSGKPEPRCQIIFNYNPDVQHQTHKSQPQGAGITLTSHSFSGEKQDDQGFACGDGISDVIGSAASLSEEFKLWLSRHPGLSIDEAIHRYRDEQKAKQRRMGPKL